MKPLAWNSIISSLLSPLGVLGRDGCSANWHVQSFLLYGHVMPVLGHWPACSTTHLQPYSSNILKIIISANSWQLSNSQNHTAQHARVNTDLTSKDRTLICKGKVCPFPLRNTFTSFRWSGCTHEKATEFSSVCHFFSCSKRDKINVGCKNKAVLPQLQAGWDKSKECVSQIKRQKTIIRFNRHGTFHSWDWFKSNSSLTHQSPITLWLYFKPVRQKEKELSLERLTVSQSQTFLFGDLICPPSAPPAPPHTQKTDTFV